MNCSLEVRLKFVCENNKIMFVATAATRLLLFSWLSGTSPTSILGAAGIDFEGTGSLFSGSCSDFQQTIPSHSISFLAIPFHCLSIRLPLQTAAFQFSLPPAWGRLHPIPFVPFHSIAMLTIAVASCPWACRGSADLHVHEHKFSLELLPRTLDRVVADDFLTLCQ